MLDNISLIGNYSQNFYVEILGKKFVGEKEHPVWGRAYLEELNAHFPLKIVQTILCPILTPNFAQTNFDKLCLNVI